MRDLTSTSAGVPDSDLALLALRYAAGELDPAENELFESRLGVDQTARDAVAEAVRLSAAASGLPAPTPDPLVREATREQLNPTWVSRLLRRRPYRGHPLAWVGVGGGVAAAVVGVVLPQLFADPSDDVTQIPTNLNRPLPTGVLVAQAVIDDGPPAAVNSESQPALTLQRVDPLANPKLNPMRYEDHSPLTGRVFAPSAGEPSAPATVPTQMPSGRRAEVPTEQEAVQPMTQADGTTKKG